MSNRNLGILTIVAAIMLAWAVIQARISNRPRVPQSGPAYLIQGLDPEAIDTIVIGTGKDAVTLKRQGANFVLASKDNYPADPKQINDLITKCLDIQTTQLYTDNPGNHADLEVTEEKSRTVVKFLKPDASLLTGVIVGKAIESGQGAYVRLASDNKVYVASNVPWFRTGALEYVEQELIAVKKEDIQSVTVASPAGRYVLNADPNTDTAILENLPAGKKLKASDAKAILTSLTGLQLSDVKRQSDETAKLSFDREYLCRLKDSTLYALKIAKKDDKWYLTCEAEYADKTPVTIKRNETEAEEELKKKEAKLLAQEKAQKFSLAHAGWVFEIADWKAKYLTKELSELLEDEKPAPEKKEPEQTESRPRDEPELKPQGKPAAIEPNSVSSGR